MPKTRARRAKAIPQLHTEMAELKDTTSGHICGVHLRNLHETLQAVWLHETLRSLCLRNHETSYRKLDCIVVGRNLEGNLNSWRIRGGQLGLVAFAGVFHEYSLSRSLFLEFRLSESKRK